jgi:hypothetical protein
MGIFAQYQQMGTVHMMQRSAYKTLADHCQPHAYSSVPGIILGEGSIRCKFISGSIRNQNHFDRQFQVRV